MTLSQAKRQFLANGWWIAVVAAFAFVPIWVLASKDWDWRVPLTVLGSLLSGALIVQKQNVDELRLFHELFKEFNTRYDKINPDLQRIAEDKTLASNDRISVANYFNLCAEEYWWYKAGHIPEDVWRSWCRGMMFYLDKSVFATQWEEEVSTDSYYGLTRSAIRQSAHREAT